MLDNTSVVSFVNNMRTSHSEKSHILGMVYRPANLGKRCP